MSRAKVIKFEPLVRCPFCGNLRKEAQLFLCDMPIGTTVNTIDYKNRLITCNKIICRDCTTQVNWFDFCPDCIRKIKSTKKGTRYLYET